MKISRRFYVAVLSVACASAMPAFADDLLDQQLGPKVAPAVENKDAPPAIKPAPKPEAAQRGPEIISPEAAKRVDDQDLIRELTQPGSDKPDPQKVDERMKAMLARMSDSAELLKKRDPGELAQETQRRIVMDLDVMIELAKQQQQQQQNSSSSQPPPPGQQRQPGQQPGQPQPGNDPGGTTPATDDNSKGGQSAATTGDMRNRDPASWGGLPPLDRDEISHGASEEYLAAYRGMINRYYETLAELGKNRNR